MNPVEADQKAWWHSFLYYSRFLLIRPALEQMELFDKLYKSELEGLNIKELRIIEDSLMESIVVNMAKILGVTQSDRTGIDKLVTWLINKKFDKSIVEQLTNLQSDHAEDIKKISNNRSRKFTHLDFDKNPFQEMGRSEDWFKTEFPYNSYLYNNEKEHEELKNKIVAPDKDNQLYTLIDLKNDLPVFKEIIKKLESIFIEINKIVLSLPNP